MNKKSDKRGSLRPISLRSDDSFFDNQVRPLPTNWLTTQEAAQYLGTSPQGIRNRVYRGHLKQHKPFGLRGRSFFKRADLDRLFETSRMGGSYGD